MESRVSISLNRTTRETWSVCERASVRTMKSKSAAVNRARQFALIIGTSSCATKGRMASQIVTACLRYRNRHLCLEVSSARQAGRLIIFRVHEVLFRWFKCSCRSPSGSAIHRDERTDNFARLKMASSIWVSLDYTSQLRGGIPDHCVLQNRRRFAQRQSASGQNDGRAESSRAHVFHRNVRSELSVLSRMVEQDLSPCRFYPEGFAGCRS